MTESNALTLLVHGLSKAGKSTLSVTAPAPRLYMDVEAASRFLPIHRRVWDPRAEPPPEADGTWDTAVVKTRSWDDLAQAYQWLNAGQHPFESLIIDSISELQNRYIEMTTGRSQPDLQGWGDIFRQVSGLVRDVRDLTEHPVKPLRAIVMTAMTRHVNGMWRPYVQGQLADLLPYLPDVIGYLYVEQEVNELTQESREVRKLLTRRTDQFEAGERVQGRIPIVISGEELNVERMLNMIFPPAKPRRSKSADVVEPTDVADSIPATDAG